MYLLSFQPDVGAVTRLAARERLLPPGDDLGYAWHALFAASFGDKSPHQFAYIPPGEHGGGPAGRLLAYSAHPLEELRATAAGFADPQFSVPLGLDNAREKVMPTSLPSGTRLGIQLRVRPVARSTDRRGDDRTGPRGERDVFLRAVDRAGGSCTLTRAQIYDAWLREKLLASGVAVERLRMTAFRFTRLRTRDRSEARATVRGVDGPDAWFRGDIRVTDTAAFTTLLERGVGRHRAFGFGMILLSPPGA